MLRKTILVAGMLSVAAVATASAGNVLAPTKNNGGGLLPPQTAKFKVVKAQLAIKSPKGFKCPSKAKLSGWIFTNKPGKFEYMLARKGGGVQGPYTAVATKKPNGLYMASFKKKFSVHKPTQAKYRILVGNKYGKTLSNWAPLNAYCAKDFVN